MNNSLNILMLSKDPTLFSSESGTFGDTLKRHIAYATALRSKHADSEIRIISYCPRSRKVISGEIAEGLRVYSTSSLHRATFLPGILKVLPTALADHWRPDVVTVQTPWEEGVLGYFIAKSLKAKFLPQAFFDLYSPEWKKEHWLNGWRQKVASWLFRHADSIRVVSTAQRQNMARHLGITADKITVVPVGVHFRPAPGSKAEYKRKISLGLETKKIVLFVARFHPQKNVSLWVDVAEQVGMRIPEAAFVMVGDGPLFQEIQEMVKHKGLADRFHFLGSLGYDRLPEAYAAADIFLLSSDYEGLCRAVVESYLSGVPVVSTRCGSEDVIENGKTGFILPCGDLQGLVDATVRMLSDGETRERFGCLGREKVEALFALKNLTERLVDCWERAR